jgi:signal transduction histidine kinase
VEAAQAQTERHEVVLTAPDPVWAEVDAVRFEQVVTNLLDNAVKFSPAGGRIEVELAEREPGWIEIAVRDHGLGVPDRHRPHLFERFYQAHGDDYRSGMGLGLYISREIVSMHGGHMAVEFPEDGGTRFRVQMPVEAPATPAPEQEGQSVTPA